MFGHFFTCRPTSSHLETFNLIGVKSSKVNGDDKKLRSVPQVFLAASAYGRRCVGLWPKPKLPAAREKNLWYPGQQSFKDSREQFRPITIEKSRLAADREMKFPSIVRLNYFVFSSFSVIDSSRNSSVGIPGPS